MLFKTKGSDSSCRNHFPSFSPWQFCTHLFPIFSPEPFRTQATKPFFFFPWQFWTQLFPIFLLDSSGLTFFLFSSLTVLHSPFSFFSSLTVSDSTFFYSLTDRWRPGRVEKVNCHHNFWKIFHDVVGQSNCQESWVGVFRWMVRGEWRVELFCKLLDKSRPMRQEV